MEKIKEKLNNLNNIEFDRDMLNRTLCNIYIILMAVILPLCKMGVGIGLYSFKNTYFIIVTFITLVGYVILNYSNGIKKISIYTYLLAAYLLLNIISCFVSKAGIYTITGMAGRGEGLIAIFCYIVAAIILYKNYKFNKIILDIVIIVACIQGVIGAYRVITEGYIYTGVNMGNANIYSSYLTLILPIPLYLALNTDKKKYFIMIASIFSGLLSSNTLGGFITFALYFIAISVYSLIKQKFNKRVVIKFIVICLILISITMLMSYKTSNKYVEQIATLEQEAKLLVTRSDGFGNNRGIAWQISFEIIKDYPWFGVGLDCFGAYANSGIYGSDAYKDFKMYFYFDKAHSEYLQIAATTGVPSLIVFLAFIFTLVIKLFVKIIKGLKNKNSDEYLGALIIVFMCICAYAFQASANISATQVAPLYYMMLGVGMSLSEKNETEILDWLKSKTEKVKIG